jgi:hypothetical protein
LKYFHPEWKINGTEWYSLEGRRLNGCARERWRAVGVERVENGHPVLFPRKTEKLDDAIAAAAPLP